MCFACCGKVKEREEQLIAGNAGLKFTWQELSFCQVLKNEQSCSSGALGKSLGRSQKLNEENLLNDHPMLLTRWWIIQACLLDVRDTALAMMQ